MNGMKANAGDGLDSRLKVIEELLREALVSDSAPAAIRRALQELSALRGGPVTPGAGKAGRAEQDNERDRLARAESELKSGEFDVQG